MKIRTFIIISLCVHAAAILALMLAPRWFGDMPANGGGGVNGVVVVELLGDQSVGGVGLKPPSLRANVSERGLPTGQAGNLPIKQITDGGLPRRLSEILPLEAGRRNDDNDENDSKQTAGDISGGVLGEGLGTGSGSTGPGSGDGVGSGDGNSGGVNMTLAKIRRKIESAKRYPIQAKKDGKEGRPEVLFKIRPDGTIEYVQLARSSGEDSLDTAAVQTVHSAAPLPFYEKPIRLAIRFTLQ